MKKTHVHMATTYEIGSILDKYLLVSSVRSM